MRLAVASAPGGGSVRPRLGRLRVLVVEDHDESKECRDPGELAVSATFDHGDCWEGRKGPFPRGSAARRAEVDLCACGERTPVPDLSTATSGAVRQHVERVRIPVAGARDGPGRASLVDDSRGASSPAWRSDLRPSPPRVVCAPRAKDAPRQDIRIQGVLPLQACASSVEVVRAWVTLSSSGAPRMKPVRKRIGDSPVLEDVTAGDMEALAEDGDQPPQGAILTRGEGNVVEALQLDAQGMVAQVLDPRPHAQAGVIGAVGRVQDPIDRPATRQEIVGVPSLGQPVLEELAPRQGTQGARQAALRRVDDDEARVLSTPLRERWVQVILVVQNGGGTRIDGHGETKDEQSQPEARE